MEENFRSYPFSDADLIAECGHITNCVVRDINDFAKHKITPQYLLDFEIATLCFSDYLTEDEMQDEVTITIENKEGIADLIIRKICVVRSIVEKLWGKTGRYKTFGFEETSDIADSDLLLLVKRVVRVSNRFFTELEMQGLTQEMLNELMELGQQFFTAIHLENAAIKDRDINSRERILLINSLYEILMYTAHIGKCLYENSNEAKYRDYTLYYEKAPASPLPQTA